MFKSELVIVPPELDNLLGCSKIERLRWTKEKKLPIVCFHDTVLNGIHVNYPCFDRRIIGLKCIDYIIDKWRVERIKQRKKYRRVNEIRPETRKISVLEDAYFLYLKDLFNAWYKIDEELGIIYELSYWLSILKIWIKEQRRLMLRTRIHYYHHQSIMNKYLKYFKLVLSLLSTSKYSSIYFYEPKNPNRISIQFCEKHCSPIVKDNNIIYPIENYYLNPKIYEECSNCKISIRKDYYSSFYIEIKSELSKDYCFYFMLQENLGRDIFSSSSCKRINSCHEEGAYRLNKEFIINDIYLPSEAKTLNFLKLSYLSAVDFMKGNCE